MSEFDTVGFIAEVATRPQLWDVKNPEYKSKHLREEAWGEVCTQVYTGYAAKDDNEQSRIRQLLQRRWRSLRDCYTRELKNKFRSKTGSVKICKRQYLYYNQLSFLKPNIQRRKSVSIQDDDSQSYEDLPAGAGERGLDGEFNTEDGVGNIHEHEQREPEHDSRKILPSTNIWQPSTASQKRKHNAVISNEVKMLQDLSKNILDRATEAKKVTTKDVQDPDRLFLLSLLPDFKKVSEDDRLELKSEMILLISKWQKARRSGNGNQAQDKQ